MSINSDTGGIETDQGTDASSALSMATSVSTNTDSVTSAETRSDKINRFYHDKQCVKNDDNYTLDRF